MSTMNMPVVIDGSVPVRRPFGIFSVADIIQEAKERWLNGGTVYGYPGGAPLLWDPSCREVPASPGKSEGGEVKTPSFGSVTMYLPITCTAASVGNPDTFADRARLAAAAKSQFAVERQLVSGEGLASQPYLGDANVTQIFGGAAVSAEEGLAALEEQMALEDGVGVIHAPPSIVSMWSSEKLEKGTRLLTYNGTPVISGAGYINQVPDGEAAIDNTTSDRQWIWGSGPIQLRMTEVEKIPDDISEALTRTGDDSNKVTFLGERHFLVSWDTEIQVAALIDRSL